MNYWAIGDVHGEADMLEDLIAVLPLYPEHPVIPVWTSTRFVLIP